MKITGSFLALLLTIRLWINSHKNVLEFINPSGIEENFSRFSTCPRVLMYTSTSINELELPLTIISLLSLVEDGGDISYSYDS